MVSALIRAGADVDSKNLITRNTALHYAQSLPVAEALVRGGATVDALDTLSWTPLLSMCFFGHTDIARFLISRNANVNHLTLNCVCALHKAVEEDRFELTKMLVEFGAANVNLPDAMGLTPLHLAVGKPEIIKFLLKNRANVGLMDEFDQRTPLMHFIKHWASYSEVAMLLRARSNVNTMDMARNTPLHYAAQNGSARLMKLLINHGHPVVCRNDVQRTPMHVASANLNCEAILMLFNNGHPIDPPDKWYYTPLHHAARANEAEVCSLLLKLGHPPNVFDSSRYTPLHIAVNCQSESVVRVFARFVQDLSPRDSYGLSPRDWATLFNGDKTIIQIFDEAFLTRFSWALIGAKIRSRVPDALILEEIRSHVFP